MEITLILSDGTSSIGNVDYPVEVYSLGDKNGARVSQISSDFFDEPVQTGCVPESPFYVRWLNSLGGYDYKMFSRRKTWEEEVSDLENVQKSGRDKFDTQETIYAEGYIYVTVGEDGLPFEEWDILRRLARSPFIEWWDEATRHWHRIVLESGSSVEWDSSSGLGSLEFTFQLPRLRLQF